MSDGRAARNAMRRTMFLSQDGVVLSTTLRALEQLGILAPSLEAEQSLADLYPDLTAAGLGSLRVAVHGLAANGWLAEPPPLEPERIVLRWTEAGRAAMRFRRQYVALGDFLAGFSSTAADAWTRPWGQTATERFRTLVAERPLDPSGLVGPHFDGGLVVPTMLWLHETGALAEEGPEFSTGDPGAAMAQLLTDLGWIAEPRGGWTASGRQARAFGLNFGGVATYLPLLSKLPELYRGELTVVPDPTAGAPEWHVHRDLNVRISAAAHERYFADSEPLFLEIFNREPLAAQPRFIADMGCGEGSWLAHLQQLIERQTLRGKNLAEHPLTMVGIDPDGGALEQARRKLDADGVSSLLIRGDVTHPDRLAADLAEHGLAIEDGLHIRSFIDHERAYLGAGPEAPSRGWASGVYMDIDGAPLSSAAVEADLVAHLRRWAQHVPRHGMVVLEAHGTAPAIVARNLGSLHGIAFDAHQAYSKQYPVDHPAFLECCREAGLQPVSHREIRYPASRPFVAVSLNRLLASSSQSPLPMLVSDAPGKGTWRPEPDVDLEDGEALHRILFRHGDLRYPATWCSAPTGFVVAGALAAIEARIGVAGRGETIRVLDYGAGTGTASIELLKACRELALEQRLSERGIVLEIHLVDMPSSWYAKGYELLAECAWVRFHSLLDEQGRFRRLADVIGGVTVDVAMANMVFHLIPPRALDRSMAELAEVLAPGGQLLWSAPDLGPAGPSAVLLHDPNRALRERWLQLLRQEAPANAPLPPFVRDAARGARESLDEKALREAQERADRRIRQRPLASDVTTALAGAGFEGKVEARAYEMLSEDIVDGLLVPSNQAEFLPEIEQRDARERVIRELMLGEVLPQLQDGPAGTSLGLSYHWTLGTHRRHP